VESSPALGDIDGDGKLEIVVGSNDDKLYALNGEDGSVLWSYTTGGDIVSSPALGDIDGDGKLEIVVGSNDDKLYALNGELTGIEKPTSIVPEVIFVLQNQPNPFTVTTEIRYGLPENLNVNITVYNLLGEKIVTLVDENKKAGYYTTIWDGRDNTGRNLSSGVYFIKFNAGGYSRILKAILME